MVNWNPLGMWTCRLNVICPFENTAAKALHPFSCNSVIPKQSTQLPGVVLNDSLNVALDYFGKDDAMWPYFFKLGWKPSAWTVGGLKRLFSSNSTRFKYQVASEKNNGNPEIFRRGCSDDLGSSRLHEWLAAEFVGILKFDFSKFPKGNLVGGSSQWM